MSGTSHADIKYLDQAEKPVLSAYAKKLLGLVCCAYNSRSRAANCKWMAYL